MKIPEKVNSFIKKVIKNTRSNGISPDSKIQKEIDKLQKKIYDCNAEMVRLRVGRTILCNHDDLFVNQVFDIATREVVYTVVCKTCLTLMNNQDFHDGSHLGKSFEYREK